MRVSNLRLKEIQEEIIGQAYANASDLMSDVVKAAKARLIAGIKTKPPIVRVGKFSGANVSFTPKTGANKGQKINFATDRRWTGRHNEPVDTMVDTIRMVKRPSKGNIRVYAGNFKAYWAFMVERGTSKTAAIPFLRPAFEAAKRNAFSFIKNGK